MNHILKTFIKCANEFEKKKDIDSMVQHLQMLSTCDDLSVFDPSSFEASEFYSILYRLLSQNLPDLVWPIINVLQVAIRNPSASSVLVRMYHYIQPLTTILDSQMTSDRKFALLKIIQDLTYGVVICWQEVHLPNLMRMLLDIITSGEGKLIPIALGVLVNLCHKNKPGVYTLMNCVDIKIFLKTILNLQRDNVEISVQVCKLLIVLNQLSGNVPDPDILSFVRVSYLRISEAFRCGNTSLMKHIVDFFRDLKENEQGKKVLITYNKYEEETHSLINELSKKTVPNSWNCVHQLLEFIRQLVDLNQEAVVPLFPRLAHCVLPWLEVDGVVSTGLELLTTMLHQSRSIDSHVYTALSTCIEDHLQMFVEMLHKGCKSLPKASEEHESLTSLLHLFHELVAVPRLSAVVADVVDKEELTKLLLPLTSISDDNGRQFFEQSTTALYVEVLSFMSTLSMDDKEWLFLFSDLLQKRTILKAIAVALYFGSYEVKKQILYLAGTSSFSKESLSILSKCLSDLNELFLFTPSINTHNAEKCTTQPQIHLESSSYFTKTQREQLDLLIEKLDNLFKNNQIQNSSLLEIIELYNYKVSMMRRAEQSLQSSLEAADTHRTRLSHQVTQLSGETTRLHQLLYANHQNVEGLQNEVTQLITQLHTAQTLTTDAYTKNKQLNEDNQSKSIIIKDQNYDILKKNQMLQELKNNCEHLKEEIEKLTHSTQEQFRLLESDIKLERESRVKLEQTNLTLTEKCEDLRKSLKNQEVISVDLEEKCNEQNKILLRHEKDNSDLQTVNAKLEEKIRLRDKSVLEKDVAIENKTKQINLLEQEIANLQGHIKGLEKTNRDNERELAAQQSQLAELERMRKIIFDITGGKKSNF